MKRSSERQQAGTLRRAFRNVTSNYRTSPSKTDNSSTPNNLQLHEEWQPPQSSLAQTTRIDSFSSTVDEGSPPNAGEGLDRERNEGQAPFEHESITPQDDGGWKVVPSRRRTPAAARSLTSRAPEVVVAPVSSHYTSASAALAASRSSRHPPHASVASRPLAHPVTAQGPSRYPATHRPASINARTPTRQAAASWGSNSVTTNDRATGAPRSRVPRRKNQSRGAGSIASRTSNIIDRINDWRRPEPELQKERLEIICELGKNQSERTTNWVTPGLKSPFSGVPYASQIAGAVVWHPDIRKINSEQEATGSWATFSQQDRLFMVKGRYWIIVASDDDTVSELAIYTNGDTGLTRTPPLRRRFFCSLRPYLFKGNFVNLVPGNDVLECDWMEEKSHGNQMMRLTMVVKWSEVVKRPMHYEEELRIVGKLCDKSREYIVCKALGTAHPGS